jgi:hypothetical protein
MEVGVQALELLGIERAMKARATKQHISRRI